MRGDACCVIGTAARMDFAYRTERDLMLMLHMVLQPVLRCKEK